MRDWAVVDAEWDPNDGDRLLCIGWRDRALPVPRSGDGGVHDLEWLDMLRELADPSIVKVAFTKSDHRMCADNGIEVSGPFHDLQTMAWTLDERTDLDLASVARRYGAVQKDSRIVRAKGKVWFRCDDGELVLIGNAPLQQLLAYNEQDLASEASLYLKLEERLRAEGRYDHWLRYVVPYSSVLVRMEGVGLPINVEETKAQETELAYDVALRHVELMKAGHLPADFNFASDKQLADFLFRKEFQWETRVKLSKDDMLRVKAGEWPDDIPLALEPTKIGREYVYGYFMLKGLGLRPVEKVPQCANREKRRTIGRVDAPVCKHLDQADCIPSVSAKVLRVHHFEDPWVRDYVEYKKRVKVLQFLDKWVEVERGGRLYTHFNQTGTETGRLSSSDPVNLQQVPSRGGLGKMVRGLFQAPPGRVFVHGDQGQIEPRLMAHFSHDPALLGAFERGEDIYESATVQVLGERYAKGTPERQLVRTCFLAMGYGAREKKIQRNLAEDGFYMEYADVKAAYRGLIGLYHVFWEWKDECVAQAQASGYVETIGGHRRHISWVDREMRWKSENQAVNSLIQGSAADILAEAMVVIDTRMPELEPVLAVHDECIWEMEEQYADPEILATVKWAMEAGHGFALDVPLVFEPRFIHVWGEGK